MRSRSIRSAAVALCLSLLAAVPAHATTPAARSHPMPAAHTAAAHTAAAHTRGFTWLNGTPSTLPSSGLKVYVVRAAHAARLTASVRRTVHQQRRYGVPLRWAGFTQKRRIANAIVVYNYRRSPCGRTSPELGYGGFQERTTYTPNGERIVWKGFAQICAKAYRSNLLGVVLHEVGHAVGLGHYTRPYHGKLQIMYPTIQPGLHHYRAGDANGLEAVAAHVQKKG